MTALVLAGSFHVTGAHGVLVLIAMILFIVAAVAAWAVTSRPVWAVAVAAGLAVYMLSLLWT